MSLDFEFVRNERKANPALKLLYAENMPLILGFINLIFKEKNRITILGNEMEIKLIDYIHSLRLRFQEDDLYTEEAGKYLNKWADDGYLRAYYAKDSDNILYELTPATEKVLQFMENLENKEFIGTESRLKHIFDVLKTIAYKTSKNTQKRISQLEKEKEFIEKEILNLKSGIVPELGEVQIREYFQDVRDTARRLLGDFTDIKDKFRKINQEFKEKQIQSYYKKGEIISSAFSMQDSIMQTDQGQSFRAFWELLLSGSTNQEFEDTLKIVLDLKEIKEINKDDFMSRLKNHLLEAGSKVNQTRGELAEQLRRFLDEKNLQENKRIRDVLQEIKSLSLLFREEPPFEKDFYALETGRAEIEMILERPLWRDTETIAIADTAYSEGESSNDYGILYEQYYIDEEELEEWIDLELVNEVQISLKELSELKPIKRGVSEIVSYFSIAVKRSLNNKAIINDKELDIIKIYNSKTDSYFHIKVPGVVFIK
jgi:hypothetical protein